MVKLPGQGFSIVGLARWKNETREIGSVIRSRRSVWILEDSFLSESCIYLANPMRWVQLLNSDHDGEVIWQKVEASKRATDYISG